MTERLFPRKQATIQLLNPLIPTLAKLDKRDTEFVARNSVILLEPCFGFLSLEKE